MGEHGIPLITVDDGQKLVEWAGLCKITRRARPARSSDAPASSSGTGASPARPGVPRVPHQEAEGLTAQGGSRRSRVPHVRVKSRPLRLIFFISPTAGVLPVISMLNL